MRADDTIAVRWRASATLLFQGYDGSGSFRKLLGSFVRLQWRHLGVGSTIEPSLSLTNGSMMEGYTMQRTEVAGTSGASWRGTLGAYVGLMKPHVTVLLLGTTLAAMAVAGLPSLPVVLATLLGGACAAGSANAINCYWDRDIDQIMSRTRTRALPSHKVGEKQALVFGISLGVASFVVLSLVVNLLAALLALAAIGFYVGVYTMWLKRTTPQNIVIGGAAGAVPVLIGWAASTGTLSLAAVWMFLIIFCGRRRISGRSRWCCARTTSGRGCRCCPWSLARPKPIARSFCIRCYYSRRVVYW